MIYDCFSFFNELDILEIRLNTLNDVVDRFVLVEATWTHTGKPKPLYFEENKERFKPFLDKIIHIQLSETDLQSTSTSDTDIYHAWVRENTQRNAIIKALDNARRDDVIIISDLDEIPSPAAIREAIESPDGITKIATRNYSFWLNNANISAPYHFHGPRILTVKTFFDKATYVKAQYASYAPQSCNHIPSATLVRFLPPTRTIRGGWHFSSQGGIERLLTKINNVAESSLIDKKYFEPAEIKKQIARGEAMTPGVRERMMPEPLTHDFPKFIVENQARFESQILPTTEIQWQRKRWFRIRIRLTRLLYDAWIKAIIKVTPAKLHPFFSRLRKHLHL